MDDVLDRLRTLLAAEDALPEHIENRTALDWDITQVAAAAPSIFAVFRDEEGLHEEPVVAWGIWKERDVWKKDEVVQYSRTRSYAGALISENGGLVPAQIFETFVGVRHRDHGLTWEDFNELAPADPAPPPPPAPST